MKATCLIAALASSLLLLPVEPASAFSVSLQLDLVDGVALMSDNSFTIIHISSGDVTVGNNPPTNVDQGTWRTIVNDGGTPVQTKVACTIVDVAIDCSQATIACTDALIQHTVIGAIPNSTFLGSIDGVDVKFGKIVVSCIDRTIPPPPPTARRR